jgi:hypothetical protein
MQCPAECNNIITVLTYRRDRLLFILANKLKSSLTKGLYIYGTTKDGIYTIYSVIVVKSFRFDSHSYH